MDEYLEQILAEMPDSALQDVVRNILDEPIPEAVKRRLLRPLQPRKYRPVPLPRKAKERKRKAIQEEFDPIPLQKVYRSVGDYQEELRGLFEEPEELAFRRARWAGPGALLHQSRPILGCSPQKDRSRAGAAHRLRPAPLHREGDAGRHLDGVEAPHQGEQPRSRGIRPGKTKQPHSLP